MSVADLIDLLHTCDKDLKVVVESLDLLDNRSVDGIVHGNGCVVLYHGEVNNRCKMCGVNETSEDSAYCDEC